MYTHIGTQDTHCPASSAQQHSKSGTAGPELGEDKVQQVPLVPESLVVLVVDRCRGKNAQAG